ncbi:Bug family tripartite tricarboxylate transporter substrate binding protein [Variovorax dokdonensis]|uniref:Bug family tripartite tricarboxylate transporter substrate binding protein n=1 Tax=Variovorax dokdonensis TaxID=344883 RepID=A0ABT7NFE4_9BURK|nr:Bug family tripartite tricarboxylate transporter substrate binding protein [Variovorax dokdonensis]MDM0046661.1 Bug family tripartite tricarboxylate transporter substrate binding protein [Variovorax dokdonensis]
MDRRHFLHSLKAGAALAALSPLQHALAQLNGNASIVSGFPAGGMGDHVARPLAEKLRGRYATSVVVEAKTGAGGRIAVEYVKRAAPDGLTILQIPSSPMTLYPNTYRKLNYDPQADFVPVTSTVNYAFVLTAGPGLPAEIKTVADYLRWAKANPAQANYGVPAAGSALHFVGMMLQKASGVDLTAVAYRGGAPLLNDVLGGQVPVSVSVLGEVMPHIRAGKLRGLAVSSAQRSTFLPDVPTFVEQGFADIAVQEWLGWFLPARTPAETVQRLNALVREGLQAPEFIEALAKSGLQPVHQSPEEFARIVQADRQRWAPIVKAAHFTAED